MPATPEDAIPAAPATPQEPPSAAQAPSKLPPSIASAFAAAAYALQHGDPDGAQRRENPAPGQGLMPGLYASMVGAPSRDYYLRLFERFDALGKGLPTWNAAAGLFTLPWCGLRGLWREGAIYAVAACGTALVWSLGLRPLMGLPPAVAHGIDATLALLAIAIPGLGANTLYWRHVRKHTLQAIGEAPNMAEAHERLSRHAVTPARKRLAVLAGVLLATAATAVAWGLAVRATATPQTAASALAAPASPSSVAQATLQPIQNAAPATAAAPAPVAAATPAAPTPPAALPQTLAEAQPTSPPPPPPPPPGPATPAPMAAAAMPGQVVAAAIEPVAKPPAEPAPAPAKSAPAKPAPASKAAAAPAKPPEPAKTAAAKAAPAKAEAAKPAPGALEPGNYYVNIGVFSDAANAGRVVARLEKAKLPALKQTLHSNKGEIVRVRSGPFAQQRRADQAAGKIRKMGMEATVFHHAPQEERSGRR